MEKSCSIETPTWFLLFLQQNYFSVSSISWPNTHLLVIIDLGNSILHAKKLATGWWHLAIVGGVVNPYLISPFTVWKFRNLSAIHILREINFEDCRSQILWIVFFGKFPPLEIAKKWQFLELLESQKLISRKIWVTEKFWIFHTV